MLAKIVLTLTVCAVVFAADAPTFDNTVKPVLTNTCAACHNSQLPSGGLDLATFSRPESIAENRPEWEKIVDRLRAGEMPPPGVPRPARLDAVIQYVQSEFDKADRNIKPDPGRVTARRLNRSEYSNTIRDLLAVEYH